MRRDARSQPVPADPATWTAGGIADADRGSRRPDPELDVPGVDLREKLDIVSHRFAWDGRRLVITHGPTLARLTERTMSASTVHAMEGCSARWAFEKLWPGEPDPFAPSEVGVGAHTVLERLYALPPAERTMHAAMTIVRQVAHETTPGDEPLLVAVRDRWMAEVYVAFKGIFDIEDPARIDVMGRELEVRAEIAGIGFVGYIDRLDRLPGGALSLVDFKTSASLPKNITQWGDQHGDQLRLYLLALERINGRLPDSAYLHYVRLGQTKKVAQSRKRLAETRDKFLVAAEKLALIGDTAALTPAPGPLCGWCPLVNVCPSAQAEGRVDRTEHAVAAEWLPIPTVDRSAATASRRASCGAQSGHMPGGVADGPAGARAGIVDARPAAHVDRTASQTNRTHEGDTVTRLKEGQPYVELADGDLNPNSYAAMAATDVVEMAVYALDKAGVPLTRSGVQALAGMYAAIILDVQRPVTGSSGWQEGMNSRARFLVKRVLRTLPTPVHATTVEEWQEWAGKVVKRAGLMWRAAYQLWSDGAPDDPAEQVRQAVTAAKEMLPASQADGSCHEAAEASIDRPDRHDTDTAAGDNHDNGSSARTGASRSSAVHKPDHTGPTRHRGEDMNDVGFGDFDL